MQYASVRMHIEINDLRPQMSGSMLMGSVGSEASDRLQGRTKIDASVDIR